MRADDTAVQIDCPGCGKTLDIPVTLRMTDRVTASAAFNTDPVRAHLEEHAAAEGGEEAAS